jgi:sporulation protein YlmC with PRC-barrel domain
LPLNAFELVGKEVITSDGRNIGEVVDLAIEPAGWKVRDLRVAIDKRIAEELGLQTRGKGVFQVRTASIKTVGDMIMLNQTMKVLADFAASAKKTGDDEPFD